MPSSYQQPPLTPAAHAQKAPKQPYWLHRGFCASILWPLSCVFYAVSVLRRWWLTHLRTPWKASVPLVVVGNLTAGGAGKTPTVMALIKHLQQQGHQPGVVSRGYGRKTQNSVDCLEVTLKSTPEEVGDEPLLIQRKTGVRVFVAAKRKQAVQALLTQYPDTTIIISDDGLQHYALARDIEIAVFDERGAGNNWLIPAGPLREPLCRVRETDLILFNADQPPTFPTPISGYSVKRTLCGYLPLHEWAQTPAAQRKWLSMQSLVLQQKEDPTSMSAVAGIGNPQRFFNMLMQQGITLTQTLALPDHFDFTATSFDTMHSDIVLVTEKDATKCLQLKYTQQIFVIALCYEPEVAFFNQFDARLQAVNAKL